MSSGEEEYSLSDEEKMTEKERLLAENKKLREQIRSLKNMENAVEHDAKLKVVGKGAKRFEAELQELNEKLKNLQSPRH